MFKEKEKTAIHIRLNEGLLGRGELPEDPELLKKDDAPRSEAATSEERIEEKENGGPNSVSSTAQKGGTRQEEFASADGRPRTRMTTKWTQSGRLFLYNLLKENGILPVMERRASKGGSE